MKMTITEEEEENEPSFEQDSHDLSSSMSQVDGNDLINMIKQKIVEEKLLQKDYIKTLRSRVEFLKGELAHKNNVISTLIIHIGKPIDKSYSNLEYHLRFTKKL